MGCHQSIANLPPSLVDLWSESSLDTPSIFHLIYSLTILSSNIQYHPCIFVSLHYRIRVLDLNQGQGWYITYDPKPKLLYCRIITIAKIQRYHSDPSHSKDVTYLSIPLPIEFEILPCELDAPFQGTPQVHMGIPHMNFGGSPFSQNTSK